MGMLVHMLIASTAVLVIRCNKSSDTACSDMSLIGRLHISLVEVILNNLI